METGVESQRTQNGGRKLARPALHAEVGGLCKSFSGWVTTARKSRRMFNSPELRLFGQIDAQLRNHSQG